MIPYINVLCETLTAVSAEKVNAIAIFNAEKCDVFTLFGIYQQKITDITQIAHP